MVKIYTRTGDLGDTGLFGGPRVAKDDPRIEAYGTVDELNSVLGVARAILAASGDATAQPAPATCREIDAMLAGIQNDLFDLGAELATPDAAERNLALPEVCVEELEQAIDRFDAENPPLKQFVLPGGSPLAAYLHLGRTVCRRAERQLLTFQRQDVAAGRTVSLVYLNRLSDLLFVLARYVNNHHGPGDVPWQKRSDRRPPEPTK